jgi:hypothetical protein
MEELELRVLQELEQLVLGTITLELETVLQVA